MTTELRIIEPRSLSQALALLGDNPGARCLAGGATLVATMNAGLADEIPLLVNLRSLAELRGIERRDDGSVRIGAMTRHVETSRSELLADGQRVVTAAARVVANRVVRNMGTIGGSMAFADPAADYLPALMAADAVIEIAGAAATRRVPITEFCRDWYTTALEPAEIIVAIELPAAPVGTSGLYRKFSRTHGDFAIASIALVFAKRSGRVTQARIAVGACGPGPVRRPAVESLLVGSPLDATTVARVGQLLAESCDPVDDVRASSAFRRALIPRLLATVLEVAWNQAESAS